MVIYRVFTILIRITLSLYINFMQIVLACVVGYNVQLEELLIYCFDVDFAAFIRKYFCANLLIFN